MRTNIQRRVFTSFITLLLVLQFASYQRLSVFAQTNTSVGWTSSHDEVLNQWLDARIAKLGIAGIGVAIVQREQVLYCKGIGLANVTKQKPATASTRFRIGSQSKLFTTIAVAQLVQEQKLRWDDPVEKYIRWLPQLRDPSGDRTALTFYRDTISNDSFAAAGAYGQFVYVSPVAKTVIVLFSSDYEELGDSFQEMIERATEKETIRWRLCRAICEML